MISRPNSERVRAGFPDASGDRRRYRLRQAVLPGQWGALPAHQRYVIGVEIAGRGQRVVVAEPSGRIVAEARSIDASAPAPVVVDTVKSLIDQACRTAGADLSEIARIGIAFGGPVDPDRGVTLLSHRAPGFEQFPLVNLLEELVGIPSVLENDARAAAVGEATYGAARGCADVVYVHLGTGVGGGIIVDGQLVHGGSGTAGEIGHMVVSTGGPICSCGKPGHLEAYAAAPAIIEGFRERLRRARPEAVEAWSRPRAITVRSIFEQAQAGDEIAREVVTETVRVLGLAIANLITVLNPAAVIVGGSVAEVGAPLMDPLGARVRQYSYPASVRRLRLATAEFRGDSAILGAVALALRAAASG